MKRKLTDRELEEEIRRIEEHGVSSDESNFDGDENEDPFDDSGSSVHYSDDSDSDVSVGNETINLEAAEPTRNPIEWGNSEEDLVVYDFTGSEGLKVNFDKNISPIDMFLTLFDNTLFDKIVNWTNSKAAKVSKTLEKKSNMHRWKNIDKTELKKFLGLCIAMGNVQMPSIKCYWSKHEIYYHPLFTKTMGRNRFEIILRCMCFYNENDDLSDRMHKINNIRDHILENIQKVYYPGRNLSVDEALLLWRGRLIFRQYIPNKAAKYGIKLYELCTPDGFVLNIIIYAGKGTVQLESRGHASSVVHEIMQPYLEKGHTIYMDNYYSSVKLAEDMLRNRTHIVGTLRSNRKGNPAEVTGKKLKKGECIWKRRDNIVVGKWKDKRDILVISTCHKFELTPVTNRRGNEKIKPNIVADYNQFMSGVDRADQMISYYSTPRKTIKWYLKLFFHLLDICIWNACWLYKKVTKKNISYLQFRNELITALVANQQNVEPKNTPKTPHYLKKLDKRVRCRVCSQDQKRTQTWYICGSCKDDKNNPVGLCVQCFPKYHNV